KKSVAQTRPDVREEQNIARAIADQREADERIAAERLKLELQRIQQQHDVEVEKAVMEKRSSWEIELEDQLRRTAAAHSEHLEQVIRTQRQLFEIEHNQKVEEAIRLERDLHSREVGAALSRLAGIESALNSRVALDSENRRAKQFWIACHNLMESIKHGNKSGDDMEGRRLPLNDSLSLLKQVTFIVLFIFCIDFFHVSKLCSVRRNLIFTRKDFDLHAETGVRVPPHPVLAQWNGDMGPAPSVQVILDPYAQGSSCYPTYFSPHSVHVIRYTTPNVRQSPALPEGQTTHDGVVHRRSYKRFRTTCLLRLLGGTAITLTSSCSPAFLTQPRMAAVSPCPK
ncbi:unnamed protein product, partial [Heligmosomoides polygyrus]